ncbi:chorismate-binding protein [Clostridium felsineum]|uniref:chorismate-binding protein n=1 Tax=Clostridium felsineum TaxID=36839 RepID=UPI00098C2ABA|nr:chorismate-binding protein [Clostridium felsineum]URZ03769.1 Isochorismate synthase MenF [Clostridium felsineum]
MTNRIDYGLSQLEYISKKKQKIYIENLTLKNFYLWYDIFLNKNVNVKCSDYSSTFITRNKSENNQILKIISSGYFLGFKIFISTNKITYRFYLFDKPIYERDIVPKENYKEMPYEEIFKVCSKIKNIFNKVLDKKYYDVPFIGGWKSAVLEDKENEIVNFYIPEIILYGSNNNYTLFTTLKEYYLNVLPISRQYHENKYTKIEYVPEKNTYIKKIDNLIKKLKNNELSKIVISKKCTLKFPRNINTFRYAQYLLDNYYQEYAYTFSFSNDEQWIGVSPEVLLKSDEVEALTKPLAGTRKKSNIDSENYEIKKEFLNNKKENIEHARAFQLMTNDIKDGNIGDVVVDANKEIIETPYVFHLKSEIRIILNKNNYGFEVLSKIYPPATVWGIPRKESGKLIKEVEGFNRGFFTGGFGFFNLNEQYDFALVIRTAMIKNGKDLNIFAGSGIVENASSNDEWEETSVKMSPFKNYLKVNDQV